MSVAGISLTGRTVRGSFDLDVTVAVGPGQVLAVLGPNGSGKSTLLRVVAGLEPLCGGRLAVDGAVVDEPAAGVFVPAELRGVGVVFQDYRLFPHLSVVENVAFSARAQGLGRAAARHAALSWLERFGVADLATRRPTQLSGGQAQKVALARALASSPRVLLLDEPLAALDASATVAARAVVREAVSDFDGATIVVTHDPLDALLLGDRLLVLDRGRVTQEGPVAEVTRRPRTPYVASLVGLNRYAGQLREDGTTVDLDGGGVLVGRPDGPVHPAGSRVNVAVRPASITVNTERPEHASPRNVWAGTIRALDLVGGVVRIEVAGAGAGAVPATSTGTPGTGAAAVPATSIGTPGTGAAAVPTAVAEVTPAAVADLDLHPGVAVWLSAKATEVSIYPA